MSVSSFSRKNNDFSVDLSRSSSAVFSSSPEDTSESSESVELTHQFAPRFGGGASPRSSAQTNLKKEVEQWSKEWKNQPYGAVLKKLSHQAGPAHSGSSPAIDEKERHQLLLDIAAKAYEQLIVHRLESTGNGYLVTKSNPTAEELQIINGLTFTDDQFKQEAQKYINELPQSCKGFLKTFSPQSAKFYSDLITNGQQDASGVKAALTLSLVLAGGSGSLARSPRIVDRVADQVVPGQKSGPPSLPVSPAVKARVNNLVFQSPAPSSTGASSLSDSDESDSDKQMIDLDSSSTFSDASRGDKRAENGKGHPGSGDLRKDCDSTDNASKTNVKNRDEKDKNSLFKKMGNAFFSLLSAL